MPRALADQNIIVLDDECGDDLFHYAIGNWQLAIGQTIKTLPLIPVIELTVSDEGKR